MQLFGAVKQSHPEQSFLPHFFIFLYAIGVAFRFRMERVEHMQETEMNNGGQQKNETASTRRLHTDKGMGVLPGTHSAECRAE